MVRKERSLTLEEALHVVNTVLDHARAKGHRGIAVVITDKGGEILASARMTGLSPRVYKAAHRKSYTAAVFERDTASMVAFWNRQQARGNRGPTDWNDPMLTTLAGGYVICHGNRGGPFGSFDVIGGVGVAGGSRGDYSDDAIAEMAVQALGEGFRHRRDWG